MKINRRNFIKNTGALIGATTAPFTFALNESASNNEIFIHIFLRGGADGLNLIPPIDGNDRASYEKYRQLLKIPTTGKRAALPLGGLDGTLFGLHPSAAPLKELYDSGLMAVVQAVGMPDSTRSHFDAQAYIESGTPGIKSTTSGWLARHIRTANNITSAEIPFLALGSLTPTSLRGIRRTLTLQTANGYNLDDGHFKWANPGKGSLVDRDAVLKQLYSGDGIVSYSGRQALNMKDTIEAVGTSKYPKYPNNQFAKNLKFIAQLIKHDVGLHVATVDFNGWDTHHNQQYTFDYVLTPALAKGLMAFFNDLESNGNAMQRITIAIQSEFGRRVKENASQGTDHGVGNVMLLLGHTVKGGKMYGTWPGLDKDNLFEGEDLEVTTDYRQILSEILIKRMRNNNLSDIFPRFQNYSPLGVIRRI